MKIKIFCLLLIFVLFFSFNKVFGQQSNVGDFALQGVIGGKGIRGSAIYNKAEQTYLLTGTNVDGVLYYLCKKIKGDFILNATVKFIGKSNPSIREAGVFATEHLDTVSKSVYGSISDSIPIPASMKYKEGKNSKAVNLPISSYCPTEISLERTGNECNFSVASFGENYKTISKSTELDSDLLVGIYIKSGTENQIEKVLFSNVRIIIPAASNFRPYRDYIGSHLETMDVITGLRKIVYSLPKASVQAPNWAKNNKQLIYNVNGKLYTFELADSKVSELKTGEVNNIDGDHAQSFDGEMLGISGPVGNREAIYVMPFNGSEKPVKITSGETGPSYLHGWSPDKSTLVFTGMRNNIFDIYSVNIATHKETQLTNNVVLDDGPEYTPNGKYIYFNSVRTGTMQIWRMKSDGSEQEQITFDEYNNWFPHISPDGNWIVYLSFPKDIDPSDHPFYKKIYIKLMPASGGAPKTIAYVYGGQGTMNEPNWSADNKHITFVSNSDFDR